MHIEVIECRYHEIYALQVKPVYGDRKYAALASRARISEHVRVRFRPEGLC